MTKIEALKELAAKVEAGQFIPRFDGPEHRVWPGMEGMNSWKRHHARYSYHGSLDAAKALHDAVLPDEGWNIQWTMKYPHLMGDGNPFVARIGWGEIFAASGPNPARAWLLAILRALISQEESNG